MIAAVAKRIPSVTFDPHLECNVRCQMFPGQTPNKLNSGIPWNCKGNTFVNLALGLASEGLSDK